MKLVTYLQNGEEYVGLLEGGAVRPLPCPDMNTLIEHGDLAGIAARAGAETPLKAVTLLAPIPRPRQDVICLGMNYKAHLAEASAS